MTAQTQSPFASALSSTLGQVLVVMPTQGSASAALTIMGPASRLADGLAR
jgi:hypothetical protein